MWKGDSVVDCFLCFAVVLAQHGALRVDAQPAAAHALKHVRKHALFVHLGRIHFVVAGV